MNHTQNLSNKLKRFRKEYKLTYREMEAHSGIDKVCIYRLEKQAKNCLFETGKALEHFMGFAERKWGKK